MDKNCAKILFLDYSTEKNKKCLKKRNDYLSFFSTTASEKEQQW